MAWLYVCTHVKITEEKKDVENLEQHLCNSNQHLTKENSAKEITRSETQWTRRNFLPGSKYLSQLLVPENMEYNRLCIQNVHK